MSVSMKDRKAVIYGEVERLRALNDQLDQQLSAAREELGRLRSRAKSEEQRAKSARPAPAAEDREVTLSKIEIGKRLAILMKRSVRNAQGGGFESYVDGEWVAVPERVVRYACSGGAA